MNNAEVEINLYTPFANANRLKEYKNKNFSSNNCLSIYQNHLEKAIRFHKQGKTVKFIINKNFGTDQGCYEIELLELKKLAVDGQIIRPGIYSKSTFAHIKLDQCKKIK